MSNRLLIDWLSFTFPPWVELYEVLAYLKTPGERFIRVERGRNGYKVQHTFGSITVLSNGAKNMGVHVMMSGHGVREYECYISDWMDELSGWLKKGVKVTRMDVAMDVDTPITPKIAHALNLGQIQTRFKSYRVIHSGCVHGGVSGQTVYLGSPQSMVKLRVYDKGAQMGVPECWHRMELQLQRERAHRFATELSMGADIGQIYSAVINHYLCVRTENGQKNKSRMDVPDWWQRLIQTSEKMKLTTDPKERTIDDLKNWFERCMAPTLSTLLEHAGGDVDYLTHLATTGAYRRSVRQQNLLGGMDP